MMPDLCQTFGRQGSEGKISPIHVVEPAHVARFPAQNTAQASEKNRRIARATPRCGSRVAKVSEKIFH